MITAALIDSREPKWVQSLSFGGVPCIVTELSAGDVEAVTDDGITILVERKTADDLLGSLKEERLFPQMVKISEARVTSMLNGEPVTVWPYLVITGQLAPSADGHVITNRGVTGWSYSSVAGALLSIQEMGVFVVFASSDEAFEDTVISLGKRNREPLQKILPARPAIMLGPGAAFLASLPGIGPERVIELMKWAGNIPAHALSGIVDLDIEAPLPLNTRKKIRAVLGLKETQDFEMWINNRDEEVLKVLERIEANV